MVLILLLLLILCTLVPSYSQLLTLQHSDGLWWYLHSCVIFLLLLLTWEACILRCQFVGAKGFCRLPRNSTLHESDCITMAAVQIWTPYKSNTELMQCVAYYCLESWSCKPRTVSEPEIASDLSAASWGVGTTYPCDLHWTDILFAWSTNDSGPSPQLICFAALSHSCTVLWWMEMSFIVKCCLGWNECVDG